MSKKALLSKIGLRLDGRRPNELRRIRCKLGVFTQPDGSAYIEQGLTKVLAAVYGPHQVHIFFILVIRFNYCMQPLKNVCIGGHFKVRGSRSKAQHDAAVINCQFSMAVFSTTERKKRPRGDRKSTELSMHLQQALEAVIKTELYSWSQIDVFVEVLHADGGNILEII